jgi:hypothetical protein
MEPGRFDDVGVRYREDSEPPRPQSSLRRRMTIALSAWILAAGVLAAGASALGDSGGSAAGGGSERAIGTTAKGVPFERSGPECEAGKAHRRSSSSLSQSDF